MARGSKIMARRYGLVKLWSRKGEEIEVLQRNNIRFDSSKIWPLCECFLQRFPQFRLAQAFVFIVYLNERNTKQGTFFCVS